MKLFLSPHNDDETLFGAYTLLREKPLVVIVTDSFIQANRGEDITADQRWEETKKSMEILGCSVMRLGIRDDVIDEYEVKDKLQRFYGFKTIFAPAIQGGNKDHDLVGKIAKEIFGDKVMQYCTYSKTDLSIEGSVKVTPRVGDEELKEKALQCYQSQINLPATRPHFEAVKGKPEWYI